MFTYRVQLAASNSNQVVANYTSSEKASISNTYGLDKLINITEVNFRAILINFSE